VLPRLAPLLIASALVLTGCTSSGSTPEAVATTPATDTSQTPTPTQTSTPTEARALVLGAESIELVDGASSETFPLYDDAEPLLALVEELTGEPRSGEDFEDPWGNGEVMGTVYRWDDVWVSVLEGGGPTSVTVLSASVGDTPARTADGIAVGSARDDVLAAGAWDVWDEDGDGIADHLGIDEQEAEGTQSLSRPGETGWNFVGMTLDGDVVTELRTPANDYSDL
jgi:hypothetical protein